MSTKITIEIAEEGETTVAVSGVAGSSCSDLTREIEAALGKTTKDVKTSEYHKKEEKKIRR